MRRRDWPRRLAAFIEDVDPRPFAWGSWDCCCFAAAVLETLTGVGPPAECDLRGRYGDEDGAARTLALLGFDEPADLVTAVLGPPNDRRQAMRGDLVRLAKRGRNALPAGAIGVCVGANAAFVGPRGLVFATMADADAAWHVGAPR